MHEATSGREFVEARFRRSMEGPARFFEANADAVAQASLAMARRFEQGGRLLVFGNGGSTTDAQHVAVEFVHPVIVGKRALPAIALTNDIAAVLGLAQQSGLTEIYARQLRTLGQPNDIALGLSLQGRDDSVCHALEVAAEMKMLTVALGGPGDVPSNADFRFSVQSDEPDVVQEVQETTYHILWETVHIFFEHKGLLGS